MKHTKLQRLSFKSPRQVSVYANWGKEAGQVSVPFGPRAGPPQASAGKALAKGAPYLLCARLLFHGGHFQCPVLLLVLAVVLHPGDTQRPCSKEEGKRRDTRSSERPMGGFPSTSFHTLPGTYSLISTKGGQRSTHTLTRQALQTLA